MRFPASCLALSLSALTAACASNASPPAHPPGDPSLAPAPAPQAPALAPVATSAPSPWAKAYPQTRTVDVADTLFGTRVSDPYRWLEDGKSPEVRSWMDAQDALTRAKLDALDARPALVARLKDAMAADTRSVPVKRGARLFFTSRAPSQEKSVLNVRGADGKDRVLVDPNTWPAQDNPTMSDWNPSNDGTKLEYEVSLHNADAATIHVLDVATGKEDVRDTIPDQLAPSVSWLGAKGFYYRFLSKGPSGALAERAGDIELRFHRLGTDPAADVTVHEKTGDPGLWLGSAASLDEHWLFAYVAHGSSGALELSYRDLRTGSSKGTQAGANAAGWRTIAKADHEHLNPLEYKDRFYVLTDDHAPGSRMVVIDPAHPEYASWREIVPERKDARLESFAIVGGKLVLKYYKDVISHLEVHGLDGRLEREIPLPDAGTTSDLFSAPDENVVRFAFSSYTRPPEVDEASLATGTSKAWFREAAPLDLSRFQTDEVFYPSKDGTRIPMFIVHAKDLKRDGSAPALLEAYGGFDLTYGPEFYRPILPWLERGGVYAWADLRGGGEYGEAWHKAGMLHAKQNVFDDFFAAAEYLTREGFTKPERLVAYSSSNGGLLMGAATIQRPDLFRAIACGAPLLDMVRFPLVGAGALWKDEYGDPAKEDDFRALFAYSPLHHVTAGTRYPSLLMMSPADDDRVDPMHARKFLGALQAASSGGPVLLRLDRDAGHMGGGSKKSKVEYWADLYAFALAEIDRTGETMGKN